MKLFLAIPSYDGKVEMATLGFLLRLQRRLIPVGIEMTLSTLTGSCYIAQARDHLAKEFLKSDCSHLVFIDADMGFDPDDFVRMLACADDPKYEVIGVGYPRRVLFWPAIKQAVLDNPDIDPELLRAAGQQWTIQVLEHDTLNLQEPFEVAELGTGGLVISRSALDRLSSPYFSTYWDGNEYIGEDYNFCRQLRAKEGKIWMAPWVKSVHVGRMEFQGNLEVMEEAHRCSK